MMNCIFTRFTHQLHIILVVAMSIALSHPIVAQTPSCTCKPSVQVSIGSSGTVEVTPSMILADGSTCGGGGTVTVMTTPTGPQILGSPNVTCSHVGKTLYAKVSNAGNSCWSSLQIEDKMKPVIACPTAPIELTCIEMENYELSVTENCVAYTTDIINELTTPNDCSGALADNVLKQVVRTYTATDAHNNTSLPCVVTFNVTTIADLEDIDIPENLLVNNATSITCDHGFGDDVWAPLANGNPDPEDHYDAQDNLISKGTGVPSIDDISLYNNPDALCNIMISYSDTKVKVKCVTKVMRTWNIIEWSCLNRTRTELQIIEIEDKYGPVMSGAVDLTATTSDHSCQAAVNLAQPHLTVVDACSPTTTLDINVYNAEDDSPVAVVKHGAPKIVNLAVGQYYVVYTGYDDCYKSTSVTVNLEVTDNTPPVAICDEFPTVGLTNDGTAWVSSTVFDDGSYDECTLAKILVRRMDAPHCGGCEAPEFPGFLPLGEYVNANGETHYYYLSQHSSMPDVAYKTAKAMGGYVVSYENQAEGNWVHTQAFTYLPDTEARFLTGYNDLVTENTFKWSSGNTSTYVPDWASGEPDGSGDYVVHRRNNKFRDIGSDEGTLRYVVEISNPCGFGSHVQFCCADVNSTSNKMVVLRAIDASGNYNDCMVTAVIQDKIRPTITCPADQTVYCDFVYDVENLSKDFGNAVATDNCANPDVEELDPVVDVTGCRTGSITRTFQVTDTGGFAASCTQVITIVLNPALVYNGPAVAEWPENVSVHGCADPNSPAFSPENLGYPILTDGSCSLVGSQKSDQTFNFNNTNGVACFKILRTWTVIDWCKFYPNLDPTGKEYPKQKTLGVNTWEHVQEIKVLDNEAPEFDDFEPVVSVDTYDPLCGSGDISLSVTADDNCTSVLKYSYKIDLYNDGSFGAPVTGNGNTITIEGAYPVGQHRVSYSFEDKCGNIATKDQIFNIVNKKSPNAYVKNGLAMSLMLMADGSGMAEVWAKDFDNGSSHPCGYKVYFSFTEVTEVVDGKPVVTPNWVYTCDDVGRNIVDIWVVSITPDGNIVQSVVETFIDIQDNNNVCDSDDAGRFTVNGTLLTEESIPVKDVDVALKGSELRALTGNTGAFAFANMDAGGSYEVSPYKNDDWKNGVSTLDLVLIQRHILNLERIQSPFKLIAADANRDNKITVLDLTELRKIILGYTDEITSNTSWRFIDKNYTFADPSLAHTYAFPEVYPINNLSANMITDFTAIKVGDINGNVEPNDYNKTQSRNRTTFNVLSQDIAFVQDEMVAIPILAGESTKISGMQFSLQVDPSVLSIEGFESGVLKISNENFKVTDNANGLVVFSWNNAASQNLQVGDVLFNVLVKANKSSSLVNAMSVNSTGINAEMYDDVLNVRNIKWSVSDNDSKFVVHQNVPNPFKGTTAITYELPESMTTNITIFDVSGKVASSINMVGEKGVNTVQIDLLDQTSGLLYYTITAGQYTATKKMILIE
ncbi:MAG: T9SS type A sorting domain-containing protein [Lewinellaceae bacterium]|nr:T9SS type A sorting domain-containing protein [Lewinellaceae bacterium]